MSVFITRSCILCFLFLFASCNTSQLKITVLQPATVVLPSSIKRISIFPIPGYSSDNHSIYDLDEITIHDTADANQIRMGYLNGIYDMLVNSPRFERVVFSDSSYARFLDHGQLYWDNLRDVCIGDTTDVILLLQKAICKDRNLLTEYLGTSIYYGVYKITNYTKWSFLQPFDENTIATVEDTDSLTLDGFFGLNGDPEYLLYKALYTSGVITGCKLSPYWKDTIRTYFVGPGRDMKDAAQFAQKNRWYNATRIWNEVVETGNSRKAAIASFNIALAFEREDDLEQAHSWIVYADSLNTNKKIQQYKKIIDSRLNLKPVLEEQLIGN